MATLPVGTPVALAPEAAAALRFPPPPDATLHVAVHPGALRAPASPHTQLVALVDDGRSGGAAAIAWAGALGEELLTRRDDVPARPPVRERLAWRLLAGDACWTLVRPGPLLAPGHETSRAARSTLYRGRRPWLVLGALEATARTPARLLAAPLNEATNPKWYAPVVARAHLALDGAKDSQVELGHLWALPAGTAACGTLAEAGRDAVVRAMRKYFGT